MPYILSEKACLTTSVKKCFSSWPVPLTLVHKVVSRAWEQELSSSIFTSEDLTFSLTFGLFEKYFSCYPWPLLLSQRSLVAVWEQALNGPIMTAELLPSSFSLASWRAHQTVAQGHNTGLTVFTSGQTTTLSRSFHTAELLSSLTYDLTADILLWLLHFVACALKSPTSRFFDSGLGTRLQLVLTFSWGPYFPVVFPSLLAH